MYKTFQTMAALLAILICSCQKEESPLTGQVENHPTQPVLGGNMVLGRKLENPYSVENMRKAFALLSPQAKSGIGLKSDLNGAATWEEWKNNIKKINNNTKQYVDEAFNYWNTK